MQYASTQSWGEPASTIQRAQLTVLLDDDAGTTPKAKLQENIDAEIFGILVEESKEAFDGGNGCGAEKRDGGGCRRQL